MVESQKSALVIDGGEIVGIVSFANAEGSKIYINGEKVYVIFDGENVIVNGEPVDYQWRCRACSCII